MACWRWAAGSSLRWDLKQGPQEVEHRAGRFQGVGPDSHLEDDQVGQKALAAGCCLAVGRCTLRLYGTVPMKADHRAAAAGAGAAAGRGERAAKTYFSQTEVECYCYRPTNEPFIECDKFSSRDNRIASCLQCGIAITKQSKIWMSDSVLCSLC